MDETSIVYDRSSATFWQCAPGYLVVANREFRPGGIVLFRSDAPLATDGSAGDFAEDDIALVVSTSRHSMACLLTSRGLLGWAFFTSLRPAGMR